MDYLQDYLREIAGTKLLTAQEEKDLAGRSRAGDEAARDQLIRANLRLVVSIARRQRVPECDLGLADRIAEGNLGLLRAVARYDPAKNTRFSTYAVFWIRRAIQDAQHRMWRTIPIPEHMRRLLRRWQRTRHSLHAETGAAPSEDEVARRLGLSSRRLVSLRDGLRLLQSAPGGSDGAAAEIADHRASADVAIAQADELRQARRFVNGLEARERTVLSVRYGLHGADGATLAHASDVLGVSPKCARQIERRALGKLAQHLGACG